MKLIYTLLFMAFAVSLSAQDLPEPIPTDAVEIPGFKLYPNPAFDDVIYITTAKNAQKEILIYDVFGKVVLQNRIYNMRLDIKNLDPGVYVLQVVENNKRTTRKLVVK
ncbi:T9SS type A sorting domain-containing protein [Maribacter sp.]|nr:T9SS type A sorting domain-containing protein [Maribacter sp.]